MADSEVKASVACGRWVLWLLPCLDCYWRPVEGDEGVGDTTIVVCSAGFIVEKRVLPGCCRVWAAGSLVRTALLRLTMKTVGLWLLKLWRRWE
jgi:hypothetical protein